MAMKAKLKQLMSYRNRFIVIIACVVVGVASIVTSSLLSKQLREKEKNEVALWAYAVGRFGEMSGEDPLVNTIINNHKIPFIITDERGNVRQSLLIPEKIINHPDLRNKKILDAVRAHTLKDLITCLKGIDQELVLGAIAGEKFKELFFANAKDEAIIAYVKELLGC